MLTVDLDDEYNQMKITNNDRGDWEVAHSLPDAGCWHLIGFGGENTISIHLMTMQDKTTDFVVVHSCVDNPLQVVQRRVKTGFDMEGVNFALNQIIAQVCNYPDELQ